MTDEDDEIAALAAARSAPHKDGGSESFFGDPVLLGNSGIAGERAFARAFGLTFDEAAATRRPQGDGGVDYLIPIIDRRQPLRIDVKTATKSPWSLLVKDSAFRHGADIFVCAANINGRIVFMGWMWANEVSNAPLADFGYGPGSQCRIRKRDELRPMATLCNMFARRADLKVVQA